MTLFKTLIILVLIIVLVAVVAPLKYQEGKEWVFEKIPFIEKFLDKEKSYEIDEWGKNYGYILDDMNCTKTTQCKDYFEVDDIICHEDYGFCYAEVNSSG